MKYVLLVLTVISLVAAPAFAGVPDDLQKVSVTIKAGNAQGSGTLVTRKIGEDTVTFIWTAAPCSSGWLANSCWNSRRAAERSPWVFSIIPRAK